MEKNFLAHLQHPPSDQINNPFQLLFLYPTGRVIQIRLRRAEIVHPTFQSGGVGPIAAASGPSITLLVSLVENIVRVPGPS